MSSAELSEWLAYVQIEPLPDPYWVGAQICQVTAQSQSVKKRYKLTDFMPVVEAGPTAETTLTAEQCPGLIGRLIGQAQDEIRARRERL